MSLRKTRYRREPVVEVNMTNLIDIVMVLLIVFILISNFVDTGLNIDLPKVTYSETSGKQHIVIGITAADTISVNGNIVEKENLHAVLSTLYAEKPNERVYIHPDSLSVVQQLVSVMAVAKEVGFTQVGIAADQQTKTSSG